MAKTVNLFTRFLRGWRTGAAIPDNASKAFRLTTGTGFGWKLEKVPGYPKITLGAISATPDVATADSPYTGTTSGRSVGSTLSLSGSGAAGLSINQTSGAISGTPTSAGPVNVVETLTDAIGSPKTNAAVITVS